MTLRGSLNQVALRLMALLNPMAQPISTNMAEYYMLKDKSSGVKKL
jgi:hypothetical protein